MSEVASESWARRMSVAVALGGVVVPVAGVVVTFVSDPGHPIVVSVLLVAAAAGAGAFVLARRSVGYVAELEQGRREFRGALVRLGDVLGATDDRASLVQVTLDASLPLAAADTAVFWVDRGPSVVPAASSGVAGGEASPIARGDGVAGAVAGTGEPARWALGQSPLAPGEPPAVAALAIPVRAKGRIFGVLALYRHSGAPFDDSELADVLGLAGQAGSAIDTSYLHEDVKRQSLTDGLTGLWNRRQFELRAAQELERASRFGERFSVVLVDLDDFKAVNDTHGHLVGDAVLVEAAQRIVANTREVDTVARFGGEEFVLLLPQTDRPGALRVAEKVRGELAANPMATDAGDLPVTLSAGVASHPDDGMSVEALLGVADEALYAAKAAGKNCVAHTDDQQHGVAPA